MLAPERRAALLDWARDRDAIVVEDDYDAEYRYDREPVGALQGMAPELVVYAGLGEQDARAGAAARLARAARAAGGAAGAPAPAATIAAGRCPTSSRSPTSSSRGELDRHLRRMRRRYRARRDALVAAVAAEPAGRGRRGHRGGPARGRPPAGGADEAATVAAAAERGIALDGLAGFFAAGVSPHPALVLGYANLAEPAIARGIAELARALR